MRQACNPPKKMGQQKPMLDLLVFPIKLKFSHILAQRSTIFHLSHVWQGWNPPKKAQAGFLHQGWMQLCTILHLSDVTCATVEQSVCAKNVRQVKLKLVLLGFFSTSGYWLTFCTVWRFHTERPSGKRAHQDSSKIQLHDYYQEIFLRQTGFSR